MVQFPTHSDLHYPDVADTQNGSYWGSGSASGRPDSSQSALNPGSDDCQRAQQQRALTNYTPATAYTARVQSYCYPYPSQSYTPAVNYVQPPYDIATYPVSRVVL